MIEPKPLAGRRALVTGAARRTGRAIALGLARAGADLVVHYHSSEQQAQEVCAACRQFGVQAEPLQADLGDPAIAATQVGETVRATGGSLDILVNNVGNYPVGTPLELDYAAFSNLLNTNLLAPYMLVRELAPLLRAAGGADVINIGYAGADTVAANRHAMAYQISKTGLLIMTRTLAQELGTDGVRVNMVSPGQLENSVDLPERVGDHVPLGYAGAESDIVSAILYLLQEGRYISGANLDVGGGYRLGLARRLDGD